MEGESAINQENNNSLSSPSVNFSTISHIDVSRRFCNLFRHAAPPISDDRNSPHPNHQECAGGETAVTYHLRPLLQICAPLRPTAPFLTKKQPLTIPERLCYTAPILSPSTPPTDLPDEIITLARALMRKCRTPGRYTVEFTITSHKFKIDTAVIAKIEPLHIINPKKPPRY